jgi:hypothetical protein
LNPKNILLTSLILLSFFVAPALGVSVGYSAGDGGRSVSSSASYDLDDSTSLQAEATLTDNSIFETREARGSGDNSIKASASSKGSSVGSFVESSGTMGLSSSVAATADGVAISQNAALTGQSGSFGLTADSKENQMAVAGSFSGEGDLKADLTAVSAGRAAMGGDASFVGVPVLNSGNLQAVASGDIAMSVDGLYAQPKGDLGTFELATANANKERGITSTASNLLTGPATTSDGGRSSAYLLAGWRWNTKDPQIKFYVRDDAALRGEGFSAASVATAIGKAANTWDDATNQNLFSDSGVEASTTVKADTRDSTNVAAWKSFTGTTASGALAYSRTWYSMTKVGGYYSAIESDLSFNTKYGWSTSGTKNYDVQTTALHELGHTIGLGDLYGKSQFSGDTRQIMHYYTGVKTTLGNGDKTGAWLLYG